MAEDFCEFGGVPESMCAHCRESWKLPQWAKPLGPPEGYLEQYAAELCADAAQAQRYATARYARITWAGAPITDPQEQRRRYLLDPEYHAHVYLWRELYRMAFPPSEDWDALAEMAAVHGFGPWVISEFYGRCAGCGERWEPGSMIRFSEDEDGWVCSGCGSVTGG